MAGLLIGWGIVMGRAETHIDELAQVSQGQGGTVLDTKGHVFAKDGFHYRRAYFKDSTGYYELRISVGKNGKINTIYNVGRIEKADFPTTGLKGPSRSKTETGNSANDTVPHPEQTVKAGDKGKIRRSVKDVTPQEKKDHDKAAVEYFGRTFKWSETGYLLLDGKKLDFSGRHEGAPGGYRTVDHRDIGDALGEDYGGNNYSDAMVQFMSEGNIRISPESSGINLSVLPTKAQEEALSDFISKERGEVILDIDTPDGRTVVSMEYPRGTRSSKVLNDIRQYFEEGTKPYVSELAQFRYSMKNVSPANMETLMATVEEQQEVIDALKAQFKASK